MEKVALYGACNTFVRRSHPLHKKDNKVICIPSGSKYVARIW
jgi:hypothetical protein